MPKKVQGKKQLAKQNRIVNVKEKDAVTSESVGNNNRFNFIKMKRYT